MNIVNKVKVTICGKDYSLQTDETPEYISALAMETEKQIYDLIKLKPGFGIQNASVFVALTALDEAHKAENNIENIRAQIKSSVNEAGRARAAKEKLAAKVKELESRIAELEKENKELKKRTAFDCEQLVLENTVTPAVTVYAGDDPRDKSSDGAASGNTGSNAADVKNPGNTVDTGKVADKGAGNGNTANTGNAADKGAGNGNTVDTGNAADKGADNGNAVDTGNAADKGAGNGNAVDTGNAADKGADNGNAVDTGNAADNVKADNADAKTSAPAKSPKESSREQDRTLSSGNSSDDCVSRGSDRQGQPKGKKGQG